MTSRSRGKAGEKEAELLLLERDWTVVATQPGRDDCDLVAISPQGVLTSVEVKHCKQWDFTRWRKQAREDAAKRKADWLLLARIPGHPGCFYAEGKNQPPTVWKSVTVQKEER